jgi:beta-glucosidase-like glycosyl hydrolase
LDATILDGDGLRLTAYEVVLFKDVNPFGFIQSARNIDTPDQVRALCDDYREAAARECPTTIDQEGERVQRLRSPTWREWVLPLDFITAAAPTLIVLCTCATVSLRMNCATSVSTAIVREWLMLPTPKPIRFYATVAAALMS